MRIGILTNQRRAEAPRLRYHGFVAEIALTRGSVADEQLPGSQRSVSVTLPVLDAEHEPTAVAAADILLQDADAELRQHAARRPRRSSTEIGPAAAEGVDEAGSAEEPRAQVAQRRCQTKQPASCGP